MVVAVDEEDDLNYYINIVFRKIYGKNATKINVVQLSSREVS